MYSELLPHLVSGEKLTEVGYMYSHPAPPQATIYRMGEGDVVYMCLDAPDYKVPLFLKLAQDGIYTLWDSTGTVEDSKWVWVCEYSPEALGDVVRPYGEIVRDRSWIYSHLSMKYAYIHGHWQAVDSPHKWPIDEQARAAWLKQENERLVGINRSGFNRQWMQWNSPSHPRWWYPVYYQKRALDLRLRRESMWEEMKVRAHTFVKDWWERKMWAPTKAEREEKLKAKRRTWAGYGTIY